MGEPIMSLRSMAWYRCWWVKEAAYKRSGNVELLRLRSSASRAQTVQPKSLALSVAMRHRISLLRESSVLWTSQDPRL